MGLQPGRCVFAISVMHNVKNITRGIATRFNHLVCFSGIWYCILAIQNVVMVVQLNQKYHDADAWLCVSAILPHIVRIKYIIEKHVICKYEVVMEIVVFGNVNSSFCSNFRIEYTSK